MAQREKVGESQPLIRYVVVIFTLGQVGSSAAHIPMASCYWTYQMLQNTSASRFLDYLIFGSGFLSLVLGSQSVGLRKPHGGHRS